MNREVFYINTASLMAPPPGAPRVIAVQLFETGYWPICTGATAETLNGVEIPQDVTEAAYVGSLFGWEAPGARPALEFLRKEQRARMDELGASLRRQGYDLDELDRDNPHNQWVYDGSIE